MKGILSLAVLPLLTLASPMVIDTIHNGAAPILSSTNAREVPDSYIVVFKKHVTPKTAAAHHSWVQDIHERSQYDRIEMQKKKRSMWNEDDDVFFQGLKHTFDIAGSLVGYSGHFDEDTIEQVRMHPDVGLL